ncbi:MAG: hypothetical protein EB039_14235, partial [Proteobacteria bacterium]|nr:hypothetical protein [Pseudomonadota bacterium]
VSHVIKIRPQKKMDFVVDAATTFLDSHNGGFVIIDSKRSDEFTIVSQSELMNIINTYNDLYDNEYRSDIMEEIRQARDTNATR